MPLPAGARDAGAPWLRLILTPGLGPVAVRRLLEAFGLPEDVLAAGHARLAAAIGAPRAAALLAGDPARDEAVAAALDWAQAPDHHLLCLDDPRYPPRLLEIADPPPVLFVRGDPTALSRPSIAIVGSRHATRAGMDHAREFARALGEAGLAVVSGLAQGIDAAAHQGALQTAAGTMAVMGTGIDLVYPARHRELADAIAAHGALLSELPLGTDAQRPNFPRRNRLIAGLALATLVVEAARQSGSLITARQSLEAGREVMAIPGSIHSPVSKGCHQLIREGAKLVESVDDILIELQAVSGRPEPAFADKETADRQRGPGRSERRAAFGSTDQAQPVDPADRALLHALGFDPVDLDALVSRTGRPAGEIGARLLALELAGRIERLLDGRFVRRN